jgi:hypothetical protein
VINAHRVAMCWISCAAYRYRQSEGSTDVLGIEAHMTDVRIDGELSPDDGPSVAFKKTPGRGQAFAFARDKNLAAYSPCPNLGVETTMPFDKPKQMSRCASGLDRASHWFSTAFTGAGPAA